MNKKTYPITNIGSVSLLMIFVVLCLITLAILSLSGSASDYNTSKRIALHTTQYYEADSRAKLLLKEVDEALETAYVENPEHYFSIASKKIEQIGGLQSDFSSHIPGISFQVPVNDSLELTVMLELNEPDALHTGYYRIVTWQEITTVEWTGSESLNLIK